MMSERISLVRVVSVVLTPVAVVTRNIVRTKDDVERAELARKRRLFRNWHCPVLTLLALGGVMMVLVMFFPTGASNHHSLR